MLGKTALPWNFGSAQTKFSAECSVLARTSREITEEIQLGKHIIPATFLSRHRGVAVSSIRSSATSRKSADLKHRLFCTGRCRIVFKNRSKCRQQFKTIKRLIINHFLRFGSGQVVFVCLFQRPACHRQVHIGQECFCRTFVGTSRITFGIGQIGFCDFQVSHDQIVNLLGC
eukprot:Mycagemm_TRINITY_DN9888_c0_g1::TRINITY_DN9888_c0_g1_i2::g.202::m.202 type:complete len:172 gc:universal TRINITY_DN9888_c0_g1_i2:636-121(-)